MKYRTLGKRNEKKVSNLGFGCMRLPVIDGEYGKIDKIESTKQIKHSIELGLNYIDTAYPYHEHTSEDFVGELLQELNREEINLATKLPSWLIKSREDMDKYLDIQLEKLKTDYIDFYLLHALNKNFWKTLKENDVFDFIEKALASGKIKNIGFSFHDDYDTFEDIIKSYDWDFCQIQMNFFDEEYQAGVKGLKLAGQLDIGVIIMEPLRGGRLGNNVPDEVIDIYNSTGQKHSPAGWALRYLWNYPEVKLILSGMNQFDHINDNISEASNIIPNSLTEVEQAAVKEVKHFYKARIQVDCTNCRYCMPCPHGIHIPANFSFYNNAHIFNAKEHYKTHYYNQLKPEQLAEACVECGECEAKCPQNIQIIEELKNVKEYFKR